MARKRVEETSERTEVAPLIQCAHESCGQGAIVKVRTLTGWAKLCEFHYLAHHKAIADAKFKELGLERWPDETRAQHRKRVFEYIGLLAKHSVVNDAWQKIA